MDDRTYSSRGASALVATVTLAAALVAVSCADKNDSGSVFGEDGRPVSPAPDSGLGGPIALEAAAPDGGGDHAPADFAGGLMLEVGGAGEGGAPGLMLLDDEPPAEEGARGLALSLGGAPTSPAQAWSAGGGIFLEDSDEAAPAKKMKAATAGPVKTWKRVEATPNTSRLMIGDKEELELKGIQANVRIDGFRARVVLDLFYYNDRDRQFEGTFKLRLPNEASPFMFAFGESVLVAGGKPDEPRFILDKAGLEALSAEEIIKSRAETWENVKEARMVPREKAAFAYTDTVRRRIDPALMEWSGAGIFSARVFPLSPKKLHRIVIGYDVDLLQVGDDLEYRLDLPAGVGSVMVDLDVAELGDTPITVAAGGRSERGHRAAPGRSGDRAEGEFVSPEARGRGTRTDSASVPESEHVPPRSRKNGRRHYRFNNPDSRTITMRYTNPGTIMLVGEDKTGSYFATKFKPELPKADAKGGSSHAIFMVDISLSSNPERMNIWLELMKAILKNNPGIRGFNVLFFNVEAFWWQSQFVENTPARVAEVISFAEDIALEGATDLGNALRTAVSPPVSHVRDSIRHPAYFLLSDGAATWGENDLHALTKPAYPVFAYTTGFAGTDTRALQHLTRETGGAVFSVTGEAEVAAASRAHRSRPWRIVGLVGAPGQSDLQLAGRPKTVFPGQMLTLVGRGRLNRGVVPMVKLSRDGVARSATVMADGVVSSDLAPRIYGQVATGQLEEFHKFDEATADAAGAYARHFRVTGQTCSLLMLESEEDYKRYNIKPEEDAFVVKSTQASDLVAKAIARIGDSLADAKKRFMAWVRRLEKLPGFELELSTALKMALAKMPRASFEVAPKPLKCSFRKWDDIPGPVQEMLVSKKLDYDKIVAEAQRRLQAGGHVPISGRSRNRYVSPDNPATRRGDELPGTRTHLRRDHVPAPVAGAADALKALSSLVENSPGDGVLARDVAYSAMEWGLGSQAYYLLRRVATSRPWEPQTYHALAQVLSGMGKTDLAICYYELALAGKWDSRFGEFRKIAALDYMRFLKKIVARGQTEGGHVPISSRSRNRYVSPDGGKGDGLPGTRTRLRRDHVPADARLPRTTVPDFAAARLATVAKEVGLGGRDGGADLVVTITWNTDSTDIDLHVKEPSGEECYYEHTKTKSGGEITEDVTEGYGPEMYVLKKAPPGQYHVRVKFYATNRTRASARTKVYATIYRNWNRPNETVTRKVVTLVDGKEFQDVGRFVVKK